MELGAPGKDDCTALLKAEFFIEPPPDTQRIEDEEKEEQGLLWAVIYPT
jgi:hypothetical protein